MIFLYYFLIAIAVGALCALAFNWDTTTPEWDDYQDRFYGEMGELKDGEFEHMCELDFPSYRHWNWENAGMLFWICGIFWPIVIIALLIALLALST